MASFRVSFRVVGTYCYYESVDLGELYGLSPASTMKEIMDKLVEHTGNQFSYSYGPADGGNVVVYMAYNFEGNSKVPYNTQYSGGHGRPGNGLRSVKQNIQDEGTSYVWQYYRSVTGVLNGGGPYEIKNVSFDKQTPFDQRSFEDQLGLPPGFEVGAYNLTWRLVAVTLSSERADAFRVAEGNQTQVPNPNGPGAGPITGGTTGHGHAPH